MSVSGRTRELARPPTTEELLQRVIDSVNQLIDFFTPRLLSETSNQSVSANNAFAASQQTSPEPSAFRIYAVFDTAGVLSIVRKKGNATPVTEQLNTGTSLTANASYTFDIPITSDEQIAFQYSVSAKALTFKVYEVMAESV